jgi:hypothetical protein
VNIRDSKKFNPLSKEVVNIAQQDHKVLRMVISEARFRGLNIDDKSPERPENAYQLPVIKKGGRNNAS